MKNLNKVEMALKKKCFEEIEIIVNKFILDLNEMEEKYGGSVRSSYYITIDDGGYENNRKPKYIGDPSQFKSSLKESIIERFIDAMMKKKSEELIKKLELI